MILADPGRAFQPDVPNTHADFGTHSPSVRRQPYEPEAPASALPSAPGTRAALGMHSRPLRAHNGRRPRMPESVGPPQAARTLAFPTPSARGKSDQHIRCQENGAFWRDLARTDEASLPYTRHSKALRQVAPDASPRAPRSTPEGPGTGVLKTWADDTPAFPPFLCRNSCERGGVAAPHPNPLPAREGDDLSLTPGSSRRHRHSFPSPVGRACPEGG
jgi:hypothetical protein